MRNIAGAKFFGINSTGLRIKASEWLRRIATGTPATGRIFDIRIEHVAATVEPQRDRTGSAPFIHRLGIEKRHERVEMSARAGQLARGSQHIVEGLLLDGPGIVSRFARRGD